MMGSRSSWWCTRVLTFYMFFTLEVTVVEARSAVFADDPKGCSLLAKLAEPCVVSSGHGPYRFEFGETSWELSKDTVVRVFSQDNWSFVSGELVVRTKAKQKVDTSFGVLNLTRGKVWMRLSDQRVDISMLEGAPVSFLGLQGQEPQFLVPGFSNWYGGVGPKGQTFGIPKVMDLRSFAIKRAFFFSDHELGFVNELRSLASTVQRATKMASQLHEDLFRGKRDLLEGAYVERVQKKNRQIRYDKNLRRLFRRKVEYDE